MIFEKLVELWLPARITDKQHFSGVELIVSLSYGATPEGLTPSGKQIAYATADFLAQYPEARVVYGAVKNGVAPTVEASVKKALFGSNAIFADLVSNKIEEAAEFHRTAIAALGHDPVAVITISGEIHGGRGTQYLFQREFPKSVILNYFIPWQYEIGPTHGALSRNKWTWLAVNVAWYLVLRLPFAIGYKILSRIEGMKHRS